MLAKKVALNTIFQLVGRILTVLVAFVIVIYLTRYLGVAGYGNYTAIIAYLGVFTIVADFGFYLVASREIAKHPEKENELFNNTFTIRAVTAVALLVLAVAVSFLMPYSAEIKTGILVFSIGIFAMLLNQVVIVLFQVHLSTYKIAVADVAGKLLTLALIIWAVRNNASLTTIMWVSSAGFILNLIISIVYGFAYTPIRLAFNFKIWKELLIETWPVGIVLALLSFCFRVNTVLLSVVPLNHVLLSSAQRFDNIQATGLYGPPYRIMDAVTLFPAVFAGIVMPIFSRMRLQNADKARMILTKSLNVLVIVGVGVAFVLLSLSPQVISLIGGSGFEQSSPILKILGFYMATFFVILGANYFIVAAHRQKELIWPYVYIFIFNLVVGVFGVYYFSYIGAAAASLIVNFALMAIGLKLLAKDKYFLDFRVLIKSLVSGTIMSAILYGIGRIGLFESFDGKGIVIKFIILAVLFGIGSTIYLVCLYLVKAISKEDLAIFKRHQNETAENYNLE